LSIFGIFSDLRGEPKDALALAGVVSEVTDLPTLCSTPMAKPLTVGGMHEHGPSSTTIITLSPSSSGRSLIQ
jgi:hypothetical protein